MPVPSAVLFHWHSNPGALERLLPPWQDVRVEQKTGGIENGDRVVLSIGLGAARIKHVAEHRHYQEGVSFQDVQLKGPFAHWQHTHRMQPIDTKSSVLEDDVHYALPLPARIGNAPFRRQLDRMFEFRHQRTMLDLRAHERFKDHEMKHILVSGASGLIGSDLAAFLTTGGHRVTPLSRSDHSADTVRWSPSDGKIEADKLYQFDAVVHLAGESIIGRWNEAKKQRIRESRVQGTRLLCETLARLPDGPKTLVCASATGIYGNRGDEILTEESSRGEGFLADVCEEWEAACEPARLAGIRVVNVRIGLVLTPKGGLLGTLLPLFKSGLGGRVGHGRQWMSWIAIDDLIDIFHAGIMDETLRGSVNAVSPNPVTNNEFTKTLGNVLHRPTFLPVPRFGVKAVLGESADELALASARVIPAKLKQRGHSFRFEDLDPALRFLLGK